LGNSTSVLAPTGANIPASHTSASNKGMRHPRSRRGPNRLANAREDRAFVYSQWLRLLDRADDIRAFIAANQAQLKSRDDK
jgi:hypothetical protein